MLGKINKTLNRLMPLVAPSGVVLGFLLPGVFIHLRPFVPWLFGLITLAGAMRLRAAEFGSTIRAPFPILAFFAAAHILMPLVALLAASLFFGGVSDTIAGYVLIYSGPTAVTGFLWTTIFFGDKALCLTLILLDTLLSPLVIPGTVSILLGTKVTMDTGSIAVSLVLMVVIPTIIGVTLNETSRGKIPSLICPFLDPLSKLLIALVIAANTAPVASRIRFDEPKIWLLFALCVLLSIGSFLLSRLASLTVKSNPEKGVAMFFSGGLRNTSAVTTIAVSFFPEAAAIPALLGIMTQQTIAAFMGKLLLPKERK
jgi:tagaturonate reductase